MEYLLVNIAHNIKIVFRPEMFSGFSRTSSVLRGIPLPHSRLYYKTRRCESVYLSVVVLDILECIYLGNLFARQFRV